MPTWEALWAAARYDFGLSDADFLNMTPRMFDAIRKRHTRQMVREERLVGIIASHIVNWSLGAPKKPRDAEDYVFTERVRPLAKPKRVQTPDEQWDVMDRFCRRFESAGMVTRKG